MVLQRFAANEDSQTYKRISLLQIPVNRRYAHNPLNPVYCSRPVCRLSNSAGREIWLAFPFCLDDKIVNVIPSFPACEEMEKLCGSGGSRPRSHNLREMLVADNRHVLPGVL